jgi:PQQ-dependent dehydrogenase (methanol/ethanol family)
VDKNHRIGWDAREARPVEYHVSDIMKFTALCYFLPAILAAAQAPGSQNGSRIETGHKLFQKNCAACHGMEAKGGRGSDLTTGHWKWGSSDADILRNILTGISGTQMPAFPMPEEEGRAIVAWLRSLRSAGPEEQVTGDARAGRALFFGSGGCSHCHIFGGQGGRLGPDLSRIGEEKHVGELKEAISTPDQSLREGYRTAEVRTPEGKVIRGVIRNEDTFSLQMMDEHEKLHLLSKADLKEVNHTQHSLMPAAKLNAAEVDNLIAFLKKTAPSEIGPGPWSPSADLNVSFERIRNAREEPQNWLTYFGDYQGTHYSRLKSITPANVASLKSQWSFQFAGTNVEVTPLVVDGIMFVTGPKNNAAALDARTGRPIWRYARNVPDVHSQCTVMTNRGFAILGDRLYMATLDAHLVALDAKTGSVIWDVVVADYRQGFSITLAPLALDGKIIVGITAGECALAGFVDAYDATTGKKLWRTYSTAQKGDPARASWSPESSAEVGGGPTWMTGTYDAETDTLFWTTGNPGADYDGTTRLGDNLYTCSVLALNPATGKLKWYFQFTPHDVHDWDATETPVLMDAQFRGRPRKLLIQANRNSFFYVLDRENGEFLLGKPFAYQTWAKGLDDKGRPIVLPNTDPTPKGTYVCPDATGGTNWAAPSYDSGTGLFFVPVREGCANYTRETITPKPGEPFTGGDPQEDHKRGAPGAIRAIDPLTGDIRWNFPMHLGSAAAGVLGTAGGVVFASDPEGNLVALDARTGAKLWHYQTGAEIRTSPMSYAVDGKQYVAIAGDSTLFVFGLP